MTYTFENAFDHFQHIADTIRMNGTYAISTQHISNWNMKETYNGTLIGTVPYPDGTVFHLSIGSYEAGTSYPKKFGAHVILPNGSKCVWFDWTEYSNSKHQSPHVQFSEHPNKRYNIFDQQSWAEVCQKIQLLKNTYGTLHDNNMESI